MHKSSLFSNKELFSALIEIELKRSLRYQTYLTMLLIEAHSEPKTNGSGQPSNVITKVGGLVNSVIRETDLIGVPAQNLLTIVLLNADDRTAVLVADRLSSWMSQCLGGDNHFSIGGACFPTHATDLRSLYHSASGMLAAARDQQDVCYRIM